MKKRKKNIVAKPTGTCFDDVNDVLYSLKSKLKEKFKPELCFIVHSLCKWKDDGKLFAHAWVEYDNLHYEVKLVGGKPEIFTFTRDFDGHAYTVAKRTDYTLWEALEIALTHEDSTGPWKEEYRKHCKDYKDSGIRKTQGV